MKSILVSNFKYWIMVLIAVLLFISNAKATEFWLPILEVVDGDTIRTEFDKLPPELSKVSVRILGIDTPEKGSRAKCQTEAHLAIKAKQKLISLIGDAKMMLIKDAKWDKFGGRFDGVVLINGVNLAAAMVDSGLAKPYNGRRKESWCE